MSKRRNRARTRAPRPRGWAQPGGRGSTDGDPQPAVAAAKRPRQARPKDSQQKGPTRPSIAWPEVLGEAAIIAVILVVPIVINTQSRNICDVKDVALGLLVAFGLSLWLLASLAQGQLSWVRSRLTLMVLAFGAWAATTIIYSRYRYVTVSEFGRLAANVGLFLLIVVSLRRISQVRRVIAAAALVSVPVCIYGFYQASGRDFINWSTPVSRVFSFLGNPTYLGGFLILVIPLALAAGWPIPQPDQPSWQRRLISGLFLAAAGAMLLCLYYSRTIGGVIGFALAAPLVFVLGLVRGGNRVVRVAVPATLAAAVLVTGLGLLGYRYLPENDKARIRTILQFRDPNAEERGLHRKVALEVFQRHPLLGEGYGTFRAYALERMAPEWYTQDLTRAEQMFMPGYAHNEYLQVLADAGAIGGLLFLALVLSGYGLAMRVALRHPDSRWGVLGLGLTAATTAFLFQNLFGITFRQAGAATFYWLWLGLTIVAAATVPRPGEEPAGPRVREVRFAPVHISGLLGAGLVLGAALALLAWVTIRPAMASMQVRLAQKAALDGDYEEAIRIAERSLDLCPYSAIGYYTLGFALGKAGKFDQAVEVNKRALELLPGNASVYFNLGVSYKEKGDLASAETNFREAVRLQPISTRHRGALAEVLMRQSKFAEAEVQAREMVRLSPGDYQVHLLLAEVYAKQGKLPALADELDVASQLSPDNAKLKEQLVQLLLSIKQYDRAASVCKEWMQADPSAPQPHNALGTYYFNKGQFEQSKQEFLRAVALKPDYWRARVNLAYAYGKLQQVPPALEQLRYVVAQAANTPEGQEAKATLDRIEQMRQIEAAPPGSPVASAPTRTAPGASGP
jgi:Flp pilus assembly protein TadD/O-antigen ligase